MGQIKSALEIALERTADIKSDANAGKSREWANAGKRLASAFMEDGDGAALRKALGAYKHAEKDGVASGAVQLLMSRIQLPAQEEDLAQLSRLAAGFDALLPHKGVENLFGTVQQVFSQYLLSQEQLAQALEQQFAPKLRQKELALEQQTGQQIKLSPHQDPEFAQLFQRNMDKLREQYEGAVEEVKSRIRALAGLEEPADEA